MMTSRVSGFNVLKYLPMYTCLRLKCARRSASSCASPRSQAFLCVFFFTNVARRCDEASYYENTRRSARPVVGATYFDGRTQGLQVCFGVRECPLYCQSQLHLNTSTKSSISKEKKIKIKRQ